MNKYVYIYLYVYLLFIIYQYYHYYYYSYFVFFGGGSASYVDPCRLDLWPDFLFLVLVVDQRIQTKWL
jgi:hypothetical protein